MTEYELEDAIAIYHLKSPPRETSMTEALFADAEGANHIRDLDLDLELFEAVGYSNNDLWQDISSEAMDGRWIVIEGEMSGGDTSSARIARWNPKTFNGIEYEWQAFDAIYDADRRPSSDLWNWYSAGRVRHWMPLP